MFLIVAEFLLAYLFGLIWMNQMSTTLITSRRDVDSYIFAMDCSSATLSSNCYTS